MVSSKGGKGSDGKERRGTTNNINTAHREPCRCPILSRPVQPVHLSYLIDVDVMGRVFPDPGVGNAEVYYGGRLQSLVQDSEILVYVSLDLCSRSARV